MWDRDGGRQDFESRTAEEYEQWEGKEQKDNGDDLWYIQVTTKKYSEKVERRKDPGHDTDHHSGLDGSSAVVPQWEDDQQIPEIQDKQLQISIIQRSDTEGAPHAGSTYSHEQDCMIFYKKVCTAIHVI